MSDTNVLSQEQIEQFEHDGCLTVGGILGEEDLDGLTRALDRVLEKGPDGFGADEPQPVSYRDLGGGGGGVSQNPVWQIVNIWEAERAFAELVFHPFVVKAISQLTGESDLMVWHDQVQYKPAGYGGATRWHQDAPLWPIIRPMTPVSAWIPFDDADEENGCMWMVPGSHRWGNQMDFLRTQGELTRRERFGGLAEFEAPGGAEVAAKPWPVKRGEVSFHHSVTWHGSPFNESERPRRAIAIHYMTGEARYDAKGEHLMKQFVDLEDGAPMAEAGPHFPRVCEGGRPLPYQG